MTLKLWLEHLGLQLPPASTLSENLNAVSNQTRRLIHADVRQDPLIGPIFNAQIKDGKEHLEIVTSFGKHSPGGPRTYARPMPMKHLPLHLKEEHFERWLFLWQANCRAQLPIEATWASCSSPARSPIMASR